MTKPSNKLSDPIFVPKVGAINKSELKSLTEDQFIKENFEFQQNANKISYFKIQFIEEVIKLWNKIQNSNKPLGLIKENKLKTMSDEIKQLKSQIQQIHKSGKNNKSSKSMK